MVGSVKRWMVRFFRWLHLIDDTGPDAGSVSISNAASGFNPASGSAARAVAMRIAGTAPSPHPATNDQMLRGIVDNLPVLISYIDADQVYRFCNATFEEWLGLRQQDIIDKPVIQALGPAVYAERHDFIERALAGQRVVFELSSMHKGQIRYQRTVYTPHLGTDGKVIGIDTVSTDITELKMVEQELVTQARFDSLTGLPNRQYLHLHMLEAIARARRSGDPMAVMFLDLDRFKLINDTYGHAAGDTVLKTFGTRVKGAVRQVDIVARLAGDEFVVLAEGVQSEKEAMRIAEKIIAAVTQELALPDAKLIATTSIGIAYSFCAEATPELLLSVADTALYQAKQNGRNTYSLLKTD